MKVIWEVNDIVSGIKVGKIGVQERFMIGYVVTSECTYHSLNSLTDGMVCRFDNKSALVKSLNNDDYLPEVILESRIYKG